MLQDTLTWLADKNVWEVIAFETVLYFSDWFLMLNSSCMEKLMQCFEF